MKTTRLRMADTNPLNLYNVVELWLSHLEARGCSTNTITVYRFIVTTFIREVGNIPITEVTPDTVRQYLIARRRAGRSPQTIAGNYRTLNALFAWAVKQNLIESNPCAYVDAPKRERVIKHVPTPEEIETLLGACDGKDFVRVRDRALLLTLLDTGLRIHECHQLRVGDVVQETFAVRGKGGRFRYVFLSGETRLALVRYVKLLGNLPADAPLWWCRHKSKTLTLGGLKQAVENIGKRAGVKLSPHMLRRAFATWSLRNGVSLEHLRLLMGHSDLKTTQVYLTLLEDDLKTAHQQHSPVNLLKKR
ncbi:MAG: tyrosine recombinase XerC [Armatimonadota bacterium]|nr:MAG: tyrosine recombinase XerC [Armatimonadota bacterium]